MIFPQGTTKLRFHYTAGGGWQGDAAIDVVSIQTQGSSGGATTYT